MLGGIIVSSIFSALISLIKYVADASETLPAITFWQMGSFANATYRDIEIAFVPITAGIIGLYLLHWKINLFSLGDKENPPIKMIYNSSVIVRLSAKQL